MNSLRGGDKICHARLRREDGAPGRKRGTLAQKTISVCVPTELIHGDVFFWQSLQAAAVVTAVPIALAFNLLLERFISGFTMGAVKT